MLTKTFDPWLETVYLLTRPTGKVLRHGYEAKRASLLRYGDPRRNVSFERSHENAQVYVRERLTEVTIVVDWSDSTMCNYICQIWRVGRASGRGQCAVSGDAISRGDLVYRPIPLRPLPSNAKAMIRASEVEAALKRNSDDGVGASCHESARRARTLSTKGSGPMTAG